jgi:hypothetical protein
MNDGGADDYKPMRYGDYRGCKRAARTSLLRNQGMIFWIALGFIRPAPA